MWFGALTGLIYTFSEYYYWDNTKYLHGTVQSRSLNHFTWNALGRIKEKGFKKQENRLK